MSSRLRTSHGGSQGYLTDAMGCVLARVTQPLEMHANFQDQGGFLDEIYPSAYAQLFRYLSRSVLTKHAVPKQSGILRAFPAPVDTFPTSSLPDSSTRAFSGVPHLQNFLTTGMHVRAS